VLDDRRHRRTILGELRGPQERHVQAAPPSQSRDLVVICAERDVGQADRSERRFGCLLEQRLAGERPDVLAGNALGTPAGGNKAEDGHDRAIW
jgi:hypothetical protein